MTRVVKLLACSLLLVAAFTGVAVAQDMYVGTISRVDQPAQVIVFEDGRMYRVVPETVVLVDERPMMYTTLAPGSRVVVRGGQPVAFRDGQYVIVSQPGAVMVPAPAPTTTTITTVTTPTPILTSGTGIVSRYDPKTNRVLFTDGRIVQLTGKTSILIGDHPATPAALVPGTRVVLSAINPVVSRDGRSVLFNEGFYDGGNGSAMTWDGKYSGYEADVDNAGMQPQGGG